MAEQQQEKKKVAILGGGCGAMTAAWTLAHLPDAENRFEISVYQMGWRLGGKGASGRNAEHGQRIQEHGLHVWAGFYENAFKVMQDAYAEKPKAPDDPLRSWTDAFKKHSTVMVQDEIEGEWVSWPLDIPETDEVPGTGGELPSPWAYLQMVLEWLEEVVGGEVRGVERGLLALWRAFLRWLRGLFGRKAQEDSPRDHLRAARILAAALPDDPHQHENRHHEQLVELVGRAHDQIHGREAQNRAQGVELYRLRVLSNLAWATVKGMIADGVLHHGFAVIDDQEWSSWLAKHGATQETLDSSLVRGIYDYVFGYEHGDFERRSLAAGVAIHGILRLGFTYKGALFWEMQAGMGDIVFAPLYLALRERGVKFAFFEKVERLEVAANGNHIARIHLQRQARVEEGEYEPLIDVRGVPSWPATPRYEQLVEGKRLQEEEIDLESSWSPWKGKAHVLEHGEDFDEVVLGISIGAYPHVCQELIAHSPAFAEMVEQVGTVQTASMQLWFQPDAQGLGAPAGRITTAYAQTLNTWADMSFLLPREDWPTADGPRFLAYFCGQFQDAATIPPFSDHRFPEQELARYQDLAKSWLRQNTGHILPRATRADAPDALNLDLLYDPGGAGGQERLAAQYFRVNIDPTERYVLSRPGTTRFRLRPHETGFHNLYMAGDWVSTTINAGCVEAAVMAGMDAANALSGARVPIVGGWDS